MSSTAGLPFSVRFPLRAPVDLICDDFIIAVEAHLSIPVSFPTANWLAVEGGADPKARQMTTIREEDPPGLWLEILVSRSYDVDAIVAAKFIESSGTHTSDIESSLGSTIEDELRDVGILVSALAIVPFEPSQPHMRNTGHVYWWSTSDYVQVVSQKVGLTIVPPLNIAEGRLEALGTEASPIFVRSDGEGTDERRALVLAAHWLLVVCDLPQQSNERFVVYFQVLEALTRLADSSPDPQLAQDFSLLEDFCSHAVGADRETIRNLLQRMKERALAPSLSERFRRLVKRFNPADGARDIATFEAMARLRNDLVHARITQVPATFRGHDVEDSLRKLAFFYFKHPTDAFSASYTASRGC